MTSEQCEQILKTREIVIEGKSIRLLYPMVKGVSRSVKRYTEGGASPTGSCQTSTFSRKGVLYSGHFEVTVIRGSASSEVKALADIESNSIHIPDFKLKGAYSEGILVDDHHGTFFWVPASEAEARSWRCWSRLERVYLGAGALYHPRRNQLKRRLGESIASFDKRMSESSKKSGRSLEGSMFVVQDYVGSQAFAVILGQPQILCNQSCFHNPNLPGFLTCFNDLMALFKPPPPTQVTPDGVRLVQDANATYRAGKVELALENTDNPNLRYVDHPEEAPEAAELLSRRRARRKSNGLTLSLDMNNADAEEIRRAVSWARADLYFFQGHMARERAIANLTRGLCEVERKTIFNKLQAISSGNAQALLDVYGPGHSMVLAGSSAAYITKCVKKEVFLTKYHNCTMEVPVRFKTPPSDVSQPKVLFLDPTSRILKKYPVVVPCSEIYPVRWKLEGQWLCASPEPRLCSTDPDRIWPQIAPLHDDVGFIDIMSNSFLISPENLRKMDERWAMANYRDAVVSVQVQSGVRGGARNTLGVPISTEHLQNLSQDLKEKVLQYVTPSFLYYTFGGYGNAIVSTISTVAIAVSVAAGIVRFLTEFRRRGWNGGRTLIVALCAMGGIVIISKDFLAKLWAQSRAAEDDEGRDDRPPGEGPHRGFSTSWHFGSGSKQKEMDQTERETRSRPSITGMRRLFRKSPSEPPSRQVQRSSITTQLNSILQNPPASPSVIPASPLRNLDRPQPAPESSPREREPFLTTSYDAIERAPSPAGQCPPASGSPSASAPPPGFRPPVAPRPSILRSSATLGRIPDAPPQYSPPSVQQAVSAQDVSSVQYPSLTSVQDPRNCHSGRPGSP